MLVNLRTVDIVLCRNGLFVLIGLQTTLDLDFEITQDIHVIHEGFIRGAVWIEVAMYISIREPFGRHVVEVIGALHETPNIIQIGTVELVNLLSECIQFGEGFILQLVA